MKILLILAAIYVYFVVGNLVAIWFEKLYNFNDPEGRYIGAAFLPVIFIVCIGTVIYREFVKIKLPKLPNIPFTPKKAADFICKIELKKLLKYRIRIEPAKVEKPDCFGEYFGGNIQAERCCDDCPELSECNHQTHLNLHIGVEKKTKTSQCMGFLRKYEAPCDDCNTQCKNSSRSK
jgi:hypothetical protein